jgi:DNA-binding NarL/FixJ family response regulator
METHPTRVLVVDDDELLCTSISVYLEEQDMVCYEAHDGTEGLELFRSQRPDLVLLDIRMPGMSGPEMLEILVKESPETPMIVISATVDMGDVVAVLRHGAWDYLIKPIDDMEFLLHTVDRALERARLLREVRRYREHLEEEVSLRTEQVQQQAVALTEANVSLESKNAALRELMAAIQAEKDSVGQDVVSTVAKVILPMLQSHKASLSARQQDVIEQIEQSLAEITSPFIGRLSRELASLTPTELGICNLIRRGLGAKEVARIENISPHTVKTHRHNIRRKLGITGRKVNLHTHLNTVFQSNPSSNPQ